MLIHFSTFIVLNTDSSLADLEREKRVGACFLALYSSTKLREDLIITTYNVEIGTKRATGDSEIKS